MQRPCSLLRRGDAHVINLVCLLHHHPCPLCVCQVTRELCEAAHGGQVLLSHEGWVHLQQVRAVREGVAADALRTFPRAMRLSAGTQAAR